MSTTEPKPVALVPFTFGSLYFCGTKLAEARSPQMLTAINDYYMPMIRAGWAVPLAFVLDVGAMLLSRQVTFTRRWQERGMPPELVKLGKDYYNMLRQLRGNPLFLHVARLVGRAQDDESRHAAIRVFLRFLLTELSEFREIVTLDSRTLHVHDLRVEPDRISNISITTAAGRHRGVQFRFHPPHEILKQPVIAILAQLMQRVASYYSEHPLGEFLSPEERFMIEYAARSRRTAERIDYHLLDRMLVGPELEEPETWRPTPHLVEKVLPTDTYQRDGPMGGYTDINRKRFSETLSEILPAEFALYKHREVFFEKMLNEGLLHYIREEIEHIEQELRMLLYFVIDSSPSMRQPPDRPGDGLPAGLTPWVRGKALVADMIRDLARFLPRQNVRADVVVYLWGPEGSCGYRDQFDLFQWSASRCANRLDFASDLAAIAPAYFHYELYPGDQPQFVRLFEHPYRNFEWMSHNISYHCRHLVLVSSTETFAKFVPTRECGVMGGPFGRDSIWGILADVSRPAMGILSDRQALRDLLGPRRVPAADERLTEERLRVAFLDSVLRKAAGRRPRKLVADLGEPADV